MRSAMDSIDFEYTVSSRLHATSPITAELTCTEVRRTEVCHSDDETTGFMTLPKRNIVHHNSFIPIDIPKNVVDITRSSNGATFMISRPRSSKYCTRISQILRRFGVTNYGCSTILREIKEAVSSLSSRERGVIEVKIWKIRTRVYVMDRATKRFLIERYCYDSPVINSLRVFGDSNLNGSRVEEYEKKGCAICMEDYREGTIVAGMPCNHDFHGDCINEWLQINRHCPLCRFPSSL